MQDWQIAVLNSDDLRVDQDSSTGYRLIVRRTDKEHRMPIQEVIATIRHSSRKPVIMCTDDILRGMFAPKKEVLEILTSREDYQEYRMWLAEAKMCGAI
jgi:hypothetical protein